MGAQSSARLKGDDYQHLISWYHIISMKKSEYSVEKVKLEDSLGGLVDDVTVFKNGNPRALDFYQIKYHVDQRDRYSIDRLLDSSKGTSLMEKFWNTWKEVTKTYPGAKITLNLYSNWLIDPDDDILMCISGENGCLNDGFYSASSGSKIGKKKEEWRKKHNASEDEFHSFAKTLVFHLGKDFSEELRRMISERMELFHLKYDENALIIAAGIVRSWIKSKTQEITPESLEEQIKSHDLYLPTGSERAATVYFVTVKDRKFDLEPDYIVDWRKYFKVVSEKGDHELIDTSNWNKTLLPELLQVEKRINDEKGVNLIRVRGFSRLSPWFSFGYTFSEVAGYIIEVNQQNELWRTDAKPASDFELVGNNANGESISSNVKTVAVGISITGSLEEDVRKYLSEKEKVSALLFLIPKNGASRDSIKNSGDIVAFAKQAKEKIRAFVKASNADKLLLFYFGPLSGACFLGHQLNAVCKEIQIMENTFSGTYIPSFLLN